MQLHSPDHPFSRLKPLDVAAVSLRSDGELRVGDLRLFVFEDIKACEDIWRALERQQPVSLFQTYDWAAAWITANGNTGAEGYRVYVGYNANTPVLLYAFAIEQRGRSRVATPIGDIHAARCGGIYAQSLLNAPDSKSLRADIGQAIRSDLSADAVLMSGMNEASAFNEAVVRGLSFTGPSPDPVFLSHLGPWETFEPDRRTAKQRRDDRRNSKPLQKMGEVSFALIDDPQQRDALLERMFEWKSRQFEQSGVFDRYAEPRARAFYKALCADSQSAYPLVGAVTVDGVPVAIILGIAVDKTVYGLVTAITPDPAFRRGSPGAFGFEQYVKAVCDDGRYATIDFGVGGNAVKSRWCDATEQLHFRYEAHTLRGMVFCARLAGREMIKRLMKSNPKLISAYYTYRSRKAQQRLSRGEAARTVHEQGA